LIASAVRVGFADDQNSVTGPGIHAGAFAAPTIYSFLVGVTTENDTALAGSGETSATPVISTFQEGLRGLARTRAARMGIDGAGA
jgi:hypothetical protein